MKKLFYFSVLLIAVAGCAYFYSTSPYLQGKVSDWLGTAKDTSGTDSVSIKQPVATKSHKPSKKVAPKKLNPDQFTALDDYAHHTPEKYAVDIPSLAAYLNIPAKNDMDKARLLFTWIATHIKYDDDAYNTDKYGDLSATGVLKSRKSVCEGYSALFEGLGTAMGLQVKTLTGYAKAYGFKEGEHFKESNHAWNVVRLDGHWKPFDVTWGAGSGEEKNGKLVSTAKFNPYWFNVNPKEFIFRHLPEDANWQLTDRRISLIEYEALPLLDAPFFSLGFDADKIFTAALNGKKDFVQTYSIDFPVKAVQLPLSAELKKDVPVNLVIQSDYAEEVAAIDGNDWIYFTKNGNQFKLSCTPKNATVEIAMKVNSFDKNFSTFATYRVTGQPNTTASN